MYAEVRRTPVAGHFLVCDFYGFVGLFYIFILLVFVCLLFYRVGTKRRLMGLGPGFLLCGSIFVRRHRRKLLRWGLGHFLVFLC